MLTRRPCAKFRCPGSIALDAALGVGGVPKGRVIEVYGPESSGKTTLALHIIAEAQKQGGTWKKHCRAVRVVGFVSAYSTT